MADEQQKNYEALDLEPGTVKKKQNTSGIFLSRGWILFLCVVLIFLIILVIVLAIVLPRCRSDKVIHVAETTTQTVSETPTSGPRQIWDNPILPDNIMPQHYIIDLTIDVNNFTFSGKTTIQITCFIKTNIILLHSKQLTIDTDSTTLDLMNTGNDDVTKVPNIVDVRLYPANQFILIELDDTLEENTDYILGLEFEGEMKDDLVGLYRSSYVTPEGETRWIAATFFSPTNARKAFPCFDEPARKANFTFSITHPENYTALANMNATGPPEAGPNEGWMTTRFHTTPKMSTLILCYTVMDFEYKETTTKSGVTLRAWSRKEVIDGVTFGLDSHRDILERYEDYFDYPFPLPKIDIVALSDFLPSAMENWGLITYKESRFLNVPGVTSLSAVSWNFVTIAHELAHQYFGNLVTHAWWDYIYLKEGLATYASANIGGPFVKPDWQIEARFHNNFMKYAFASDSLVSTRPVEIHIETTNEIGQMFDDIGYYKGALISRMCESFLGEATFKKGLQRYIATYAYKTATNDQFWDIMQEVADEDNLDVDVTTIMHTWVLQNGYPVINVTRDYTRNDVIRLQAEQKRYLQVPTNDTKDNDRTWWVPLTFTSRSTVSSEHQLVWMENGPAEASVEGSASDWLLVNLDQAGYYRVNYDTKNWQLLSQQLLDNHEIIPQSNRAALINDAFNLAKVGEMSQATALEITLYLRNEDELLPWETALGQMAYLDDMLSKTGAYGSLKKYMQQQVSPLYQQLGWEQEGTFINKLTRQTIIKAACYYEYPECLDEALTLYRDWMRNASNNPIEADFRGTVYCAAIQVGGQPEWDFAYERYKNESNPAEQIIILSAMGCVKQPWILNTLLSYTLDSDKIRAQDVMTVVRSVAYNPAGTGLAWDFFRANFDHFRKQFGSNIFHFSDLIGYVTYHFNTEFSRKQLLDFMAAHPDQGTGASSFQKSVERTQANIRWMDAYLDEVHVWLDQAV